MAGPLPPSSVRAGARRSARVERDRRRGLGRRGHADVRQFPAAKLAKEYGFTPSSAYLGHLGEIVGLIFDGSIYSLGGDFGYDAARNRSIAVDSRALLAALSKVYHADRLGEEIGSREDRRMHVNGRYRIAGLLGEGAVGTVLRAWDEVLERDVAVKILKPAYASDARTVARFYAEARAAARLAHPHAVLVHDIVAEGMSHAIVMEYVAGISLERILAGEGRVGEARAVTYCRQIAQALAAAHGCGLLHRDVKPANVLITQTDAVKVADFGLAKAIAGAETSSTEASRLIGSAAYVSPEQAQGLPLTPASDLYSLGVVLYRLVTGRLPFEGVSPIAVAVAHVTAPAPREDELARDMSPALATIVARLLRKDPAERYASATEVAAALAALDTGPPRSVPAWDAPTERVERVRAARSRRATVPTRLRGVLRIARGTTTALALCIVAIAGSRIVYDHHVTLAGLRHLTVRHAAHTALVELGLRRRAPNAAATPDDSIVSVASEPAGADASK